MSCRMSNRVVSLLNLSQAAYPVYILHMIFLYLGSMFIFKLNVAVELQYVLTLLFTFVGCFGTYEIIKKVNVLRLLFGLKMRDESRKNYAYKMDQPVTP